jgi:hypothetical protein
VRAILIDHRDDAQLVEVHEAHAVAPA